MVVFPCFVCSQYEPVLTKAFYHGRTEAMRTATKKAATFWTTSMNPLATNKQKLETLRDATQYHSACIKSTSSGHGIESETHCTYFISALSATQDTHSYYFVGHLFALKCVAEKNGVSMPEFFLSKGWKELNHTILSTSNW